MKKFTRPFVGLMAIALLVITAACSGSDDSDSTNDGGGGNNDIIVGKWKYIGWYETEGEFIDDADETGCYDDIINFKSNGDGSYVEEDCEDGDYAMPFEWEKVSDNNYILTGIDGSQEMTTHFETNNKVVIVDEEWGGGEVYVRQ